MLRTARGSLTFWLLPALTGLPMTASGATFDVTVRAMSFDPPTVQINVGDTVHWILGQGVHTVTSGTPCTPSGLFNAPLDGTHPEFSFTFTTEGTVDYFCTNHCAFGMDAVVEVLAASDVPTPQSTAQIVASSAPNPFRSSTDLSFSLPEAGPLRVEIFDAAGRSITTLQDSWSDSGVRRLTWNGTRSDGTLVDTGVYFARITSGPTAKTLVLTRIE